MRILGIDPGLRVTGFGVLEADGSKLRYVASGRITSNERDPLPARIASLFEGIREVVDTWQPTHSAVEIVFVNVNPQSTLLLISMIPTCSCAGTPASLLPGHPPGLPGSEWCGCSLFG